MVVQMGNDTSKAKEIRKERINMPVYPFEHYKQHLTGDIHSFATQYNFVGKGILRNIPHKDQTLKLDHVDKESNLISLDMMDLDGRFFPIAYPGDEITFVVYCEVTSLPETPKKGKKPKPASVKFHLLQYEVCIHGPFHVDVDNYGEPSDFNISYDRLVRCCGQRALKEQRCRNIYNNSPVFDHFFRGKKVRWTYTRTVGSGLMRAKDLSPESHGGFKEKVSLEGMAAFKDTHVGAHEQVRIVGVIEGQGGSINSHSIRVKALERIGQEAPQPAPAAPAREDSFHSNFVPQPSASNPFAADKRHPDPSQVKPSAPPSPKPQMDVEDSPKEVVQVVECVVCMDEVPTHAFIPCGHRCVCEDCSSSFSPGSPCPICQGKCQMIMRIYV